MLHTAQLNATTCTNLECFSIPTVAFDVYESINLQKIFMLVVVADTLMSLWRGDSDSEHYSAAMTALEMLYISTYN